jgi:hypothetical protein
MKKKTNTIIIIYYAILMIIRAYGKDNRERKTGDPFLLFSLVLLFHNNHSSEK